MKFAYLERIDHSPIFNLRVQNRTDKSLGCKCSFSPYRWLGKGNCGKSCENAKQNVVIKFLSNDNLDLCLFRANKNNSKYQNHDKRKRDDQVKLGWLQ